MYIQVYYTGYGEFRWEVRKNTALKATRGIGFDDLLKDKPVADIESRSRPNQRLLLFIRSGYVWAVPYVEDAEAKFLKTLYASRKLTRLWLAGGLE